MALWQLLNLGTVTHCGEGLYRMYGYTLWGMIGIYTFDIWLPALIIHDQYCPWSAIQNSKECYFHILEYFGISEKVKSDM